MASAGSFRIRAWMTGLADTKYVFSTYLEGIHNLPVSARDYKAVHVSKKKNNTESDLK